MARGVTPSATALQPYMDAPCIPGGKEAYFPSSTRKNCDFDPVCSLHEPTSGHFQKERGEPLHSAPPREMSHAHFSSHRSTNATTRIKVVMLSRRVGPPGHMAALK